MVWQVDHVFHLQSLARSAEMILLFLWQWWQKLDRALLMWSLATGRIGIGLEHLWILLWPIRGGLTETLLKAAELEGRTQVNMCVNEKGWEEGAEFRKLWSWVLISKCKLLLYLELGKEIEIGQTDAKMQGKSSNLDRLNNYNMLDFSQFTLRM